MAESPLDRVVRLSRHVKTPEGAKKFGKPIGSEISKLNKLPAGTVGVIDNSIIDRPNEHYKKLPDGRWSKVHSVTGRDMGAISSPEAVAEFSHQMKFTAPNTDDQMQIHANSMVSAYRERLRKEAERNTKRTAKGR